MRLRIAVALPGLLIGLYGAWLLLREGWDNLVATLVWLVGGIIAHDAILAVVVIVLVAVAARVLPRVWRAPAAVGLVVLGTVTVMAVPVLGRFGARPDNPTLLDRDYLRGWLVLAALVAIGVALGAVLSAPVRRPGRRRHVSRPGR